MEGRRAPAAGTDASLETQMILLEKINLGEVSIEYAMERMKKGGALRRYGATVTVATGAPR